MKHADLIPGETCFCRQNGHNDGVHCEQNEQLVIIALSILSVMASTTLP